MDSDNRLEALFEQARAHPPRPSEALMARVMADATAAQARPVGTVQRFAGGFRALLHKMGGGPAVGGMITASCLGFWLGVAPPDGLPDLAGQILVPQDDTVYDATALAGFGWDQDEG